MLELFSDYIPETWFDEDGLRKSGPLLGVSATAIKRMRRWKNSVKGVSLSIAASAVFVAVSMTIAQQATASNSLNVPIHPAMARVAPPPAATASVGEINESFSELFAAFRSGTRLITNPHTRELADKAAARRNDRPSDWAHKLASDVGDAND